MNETKLSDRQKKLLCVAISVLDEYAGYCLETSQLSNLLKYDGVECDTFCLAEDLRIEFNLKED
jgi:hypothetical protein